MSEFTPLHEQEARPLPERPLLNLQLGDNFSTEKIPAVRHAILDFLRTDPELQARVGRPLPSSLIDDIHLVLGELLSNAERPNIEQPEKARHATAVYIWAEASQVGIGVGDNSDTIAGKDERPQTTVLAPDLGAAALEFYDKDFLLDPLESSGLGGSLLSMLASDVSHSIVPAKEAARADEPRTHKFVRANFTIPSAHDEAA